MCKINPTIVIVDDSRAASSFMSSLISIRHPQAVVMTASSYTQARNVIAMAPNIALVILDNDLGIKRTGSDLANELRSQGHKFGIVVVSGSDLKIDKHFQYLSKPLNVSDFSLEVDRQLAIFSIRKDIKSIGENVNSILKAKKISEEKVYSYV